VSPREQSQPGIIEPAKRATESHLETSVARFACFPIYADDGSWGSRPRLYAVACCRRLVAWRWRPEGPVFNSHARQGVVDSTNNETPVSTMIWGPKDRHLARVCRTFGAHHSATGRDPRPDGHGYWL